MMEENKENSNLLSFADIQKLLTNRSVDVRAETIQKLTIMYAEKDFVESEKRIAEDIFRLAAKDVEERIRTTLSLNLAINEYLPEDIAKALATDVSDEVANPLLQFSSRLSSEDLIQIVIEGNESRQTAVASRAIVEEEVAFAIAAHGKENAVEVLVRNEGARISEESFHTVIDRFSENEKIHEGIAMREVVPESIIIRVLENASEDLQRHIVSKHNVDPKKVAEIVKFSYEKAMINVSSTISDKQTQAVIYGLHTKRKLSASLILRALCTGETVFFENSIAFLTGLPVENIRALIYDKGPLGLPALYERARLPPKMFPAARIAIDLIKEIDYKGGDPDVQESFSRMVVGRLMELLDETDDDVDIDSLLETLEEESE